MNIYKWVSMFVLCEFIGACVRNTPVQDYLIEPEIVKPIQLTELQKKMLFNVVQHQSCRENGVKIRYVPTNGPVSDYKYKFESTDTTPIISTNNAYVLQNNGGMKGYVKATISKDNVSWTETLGHTTCNHDNQPIDCPENNNTLTISNLQPTLREVITVTWNGTLQPDQTLHHFGQGYETYQIINEKTIKVRITEPFFRVQMQPSSYSKYDGCHGWTAFVGNIVK